MSATGLMEATVVPVEVSDKVAEIAEDACQAAFALIASRLEGLGYPVSGDFAPDETLRLDSLFQGFVLTMMLNNEKIGRMQEVPETSRSGGGCV